MAGLKTYHAKRRFGVTAEPSGKVGAASAATPSSSRSTTRTRLHYDLRLELDGVMKSWAVTRGPSLVPGEKRLAVQVEDHPIEYNKFEGTIPKGEYGGGTVMIWDRGRWQPEGDPHRGPRQGPSVVSRSMARSCMAAGIWCACAGGRARKRDNWLLIKAA